MWSLRLGRCREGWVLTGERYITKSDQFLELEALPQRIVFVGGGYISFEFAHIAARAGAKVTILHRGQRPLEGFDPDRVNQLVARTKRLGVRVEVGMEVTAVEKSDEKLAVHALTKSKRELFVSSKLMDVEIILSSSSIPQTSCLSRRRSRSSPVAPAISSGCLSCMGDQDFLGMRWEAWNKPSEEKCSRKSAG